MAKVEPRKYSVRFSVIGEVERVVTATSESAALVTAKKMLLQPDGQTPKNNSLVAFCWDVWCESAHLSWREMTDEEHDA